jgi:uncharacterized cupin superfamily protein
VEKGNGFTLLHQDELEQPWGPKWRLARRSLGIGSFGLNLCELPPGEAIPEHDEEATNQEEVYVVLSGSPVMVIDGKSYPAPAGTFARFDPNPMRTVRNDGSEPALVLMVSAPKSSGYKPLDWA